MRPAKKPKRRPEFDGKSIDYRAGHQSAEEYYKDILKGGNRSGSTPHRIIPGAGINAVPDV